MNQPKPVRQVITINPLGGISGLQRKKGQGIDLTAFGKADVKRVSEILWHEEATDCPRGWHIHFLLGVRAGTLLTVGAYKAHKHLGLPPILNEDSHDDAIASFDDYDDAVKVEVAVLDNDRLMGNGVELE